MEDEKTKFFQKIDDCLLDEKKVVTYKWMSQFLNIHINEAKELLTEYAETLDEQLREKLEVTYVIGGQLKHGRGFSFQIVKEEDLPQAKEQFSVLTTQDIYSLEMMPLPDLDYLFTVDCVEGDPDAQYLGAIQCERSKMKTTEENLALRRKVNPGLPIPSAASSDDEVMDVDEGPSVPRKRSPSPPTHSSDAAPLQKKSKLPENAGPKVPDMFSAAKSKAPVTSANTGSKASTSKVTPAVPSIKIKIVAGSTAVAATAATKASVTSTSKTASNQSVSAKGKAGANTKVKRSKKIFGDTPERRVQTSLTAFFKKE